ncbi:MAG: hypothetical protein K1Y36_16025 [Blastocatellia bacterium]|nr:hypothetical protein [Blastocatellia bacterium]
MNDGTLWQIQTRLGTHQADAETIKTGILAGRILPTDKASQDGIVWVNIQDLPQFRDACLVMHPEPGYFHPPIASPPPYQTAPPPGYDPYAQQSFHQQYPGGMMPVSAHKPIQVAGGAHSPVLAIVANLFCLTGLGQIYNKQTTKGLVLFGVTVASVILTAGLLTPFIWIAAIVDAALIANRLKRGEAIGEWQWF